MAAVSPAGPDVLQATATRLPGAAIRLSAVAASGRSFGYAPLPAAANITAARYSVDDPSWESGVVTHVMSAADGEFDSSNEAIVSPICSSTR